MKHYDQGTHSRPAKYVFTRRLLIALLLTIALAKPEAVASTSPTKSRITLFSLPRGSSPRFITHGPDGNMWFTDRGGLGKITPNGNVKQFIVPKVFELGGLTDGPSHAVWFTEQTNLKIGRITPAGVVSEFPVSLSTNFGALGGITAGRDGDLWFTVSYANQIGRVTPRGVVSEFSSKGLNPGSIVTGTDGNIWFSSFYSNAICRITPNGSIRVFHLPVTYGGPQEITAGSGGVVWYTKPNAGGEGGPPNGKIMSGAIGRLSANGAIQEFPTTGLNPSGITAAPDGNLWFLSFRHNIIGRMTPTGKMTIFALPPSKDPPYEITSAHDGSIWFTLMESGKIGRLVPG